MLKRSVFVTYFGLRDIGEKSGNFRSYVDLTDPIPWWRHIPDEESFSNADSTIRSGAENNADPSNKTFPIFDNGFVWEDNLHYPPKYLKQLLKNNPGIYTNPQLSFSNFKTNLDKNILLLNQYKQQKKAFLRAYKKKRQSALQFHEKTFVAEIKKNKLRNSFVETSFAELALSSFLHRYGVPTEPTFMMNFRNTGENELPHVREDPRVLSFLPSNFKVGAEISMDPSDHISNELDVFEEEINEISSFEIRAKDYKLNDKAKTHRNWRMWQEFITAFTTYGLDLQNDIRCKKALHTKEERYISPKVRQKNLLEAVLCMNTSAPGCLPTDILPWLSVAPPAPKFLFSDLSNDFGYRWMLDTEEWLRKQNFLLDFAKKESLTYKNVKTRFSNNIGKKILPGQRGDIWFLSQNVDELIPARPGFAFGEVYVTKFPEFKPNDGLVHHPHLMKLIVCDEYPSFSYGDLTD